MTRALTERVSLTMGLIGLVTLPVSFGRGSESVVALGVLGLVYCLALPPVVTVVALFDREPGMWRWLVAMWALLLPGFVMRPSTLEHPALHSFGFLQWIGIAGLIATVVGWLITAHLIARDRSKSCPDCAERVLAKAKVCRYCGFRWEARSSAAGAE
jgi:drug/metabolite transporter (DMT)-like permease